MREHKRDFMTKPAALMCTSPIVVALDVATHEQAIALAKQLDPKLCRVKVGKELFTAQGPKTVESLHALGFDVFLDLKFHDIPNTCAKAVVAAAKLGVWMVNVHASGGRRMMEAAANALAQVKQPPLLIGVTVLTSMEQQDLAEIGIATSPREHVERLARLAQISGLDGVVCSAQEVELIRSVCGNNEKSFLTVTPGIRPTNSNQDDQRRVMTPVQAQQAGVDYMVIGRPITQADNPAQMCQDIVGELHA